MLHTIGNGFLTVTAADTGAELQSIRDGHGTEYLWQGDPIYWADRALNIFPYVGRLTEGQYELDGRRYAMRIHGLAPYETFAFTAHGEDWMEFTLTDSQATYASFPRRFLFRIRYALHGRTLAVTYTVENRDHRILYFGLGGHPGFRVPFTDGKTFEDYRLRFENPCAPKRIGFTATCFLDGTDAPFQLEGSQLLPLRHTLFNQDAIVLKDMDHTVTLETTADGPSVTVRFPQMSYLGIWHMPHTDAPYVCIEPWCSLPASHGQITALEHQKDLLQLEAGQVYTNKWTISINPGPGSVRQ